MISNTYLGLRGTTVALYSCMVIGRILLFIVILPYLAFADDFSHEGYVESVEQEREATVSRLAIPSKPAPPEEVALKDRIFNERLTKEFKERYKEKFGRTQVEMSISHPSRYTYYVGGEISIGSKFHEGTFRGDELERNEENKRFGNFMMKRLSEYHIDKYLQTKPTVRKIYAVKEQISKVSLEVAPDVKLRARYDFSGNFLRLKFDNPWLDHRLLVEMDQSRFGPTTPSEVTFSMNVPLPSATALEAYIKFLEQSLTFVARKQLSPIMAATLTGKVDARLDPNNPENLDRENMMITGLSWVY